VDKFNFSLFYISFNMFRFQRLGSKFFIQTILLCMLRVPCMEKNTHIGRVGKTAKKIQDLP